VGRAERQQQTAADRGAEQQAEPARAGEQPDRARQRGAADDVVDQELARRRPQHARHAVDREQQRGVPGLQAVGQEQPAPAERANHVEQHAVLDDAARVEAVGEHADRDREQQERHPV
jgi:hypothetical protein